MTGGQSGPTTPIGAVTTTTRYGNIEHPFNLAHLAAASGAVYVARWTAVHVKRIRESIKKAINKKGFSFIEIITPCPEEYGRRNKITDPILDMKRLIEISEVRPFIDPIKASITSDKIIVGEFLDIEKPEFSDLLWKNNQSVLADLEKAGRRTNVAL